MCTPSLNFWNKQILTRKRNKLPKINQSIPPRFYRKKNGSAQNEAQGHWLDIWLPRISHFSQFGLFVITLGSLYFVVLPIYQKSVLDEAIAQKEIELKKSEKLVMESYEQLRKLAVTLFTNKVFVKCIVKPDELFTEHNDKKWIRLNQEVSGCLIESGKTSQDLKLLHPEDQIIFSSELNKIAAELEQRRIVALKQYLELPEKAKSDPSLLKSPKYFSAALIKEWEQLHKETNLISEASMARSRFDAGVQSAQLDVESSYMDFAKQKLVGMTNLDWSNSYRAQ